MALPTKYWVEQPNEHEKIYVHWVTAALSATTAIVAAADVPATHRVEVMGFLASSSVSVAWEFQDSAGTRLTGAMWASSQMQINPVFGRIPLVLCTRDLGLSIKNYTTTAIEVMIAFRLVDMTKGPYFET